MGGFLQKNILSEVSMLRTKIVPGPVATEALPSCDFGDTLKTHCDYLKQQVDTFRPLTTHYIPPAPFTASSVALTPFARPLYSSFRYGESRICLPSPSPLTCDLSCSIMNPLKNLSMLS